MKARYQQCVAVRTDRQVGGDDGGGDGGGTKQPNGLLIACVVMKTYSVYKDPSMLSRKEGEVMMMMIDDDP